MTVLPYRDHGYVRILSTRTGETLFEWNMPEGHGSRKPGGRAPIAVACTKFL